MNKKLFSLICCIIAACSLLSGCAKIMNADRDIYNAWIELEGSGIHNNENYTSAPAQIDATIGDQSMKLTYVRSYDLPGRRVNEYTNEDETIKVGCYSDDGSIAWIEYSESVCPLSPAT